ncbi:ubiquitin D [Saccopteryx bilineata]|uniref:ubiquitin D n=1 Tax=Saccopteryx bilineata TaxID=59482 RepID=UPI00338F014A
MQPKGHRTARQTQAGDFQCGQLLVYKLDLDARSVLSLPISQSLASAAPLTGEMAPNASGLSVNVHSEEWKLMTFAASSDDRVKKINEHIRSKTKVSVQDQVLLLGSTTLKPQRKLSSYGIDKETTVHLTLKVVSPSDEELPLCLVESGDQGQRHPLQVRRSSPVAQVREMVEAKTAVPPEKQTVTCNGKRLEDGKTMADYNIKKGSLLFLTPYCIGG